ncbi:MAG: hypothetical protein A3J06_04060 [Candidatus Moranbacteria bacterium RIFCSPLOWO2_02_FULL_48_19]|nr:MAG: hypothetical protein A3J06_04060 [Candidatus Moranbacteria bacterium RIFCSPLOWO2_02_FULL_48_19]OGI30780.1 MAG: hypothetical protein A3G09_01870 [Candidatus Moranbacteria bacterium RIFCSPLOWO2_12_FULL_48_12]
MIFVSGMFFMMPQTAHADAWGANMAAAIMKQTMEQIARQIEGALLGSLKMAAVQMLNNQVGQLIGGGAGGQARFITSFDDFLYRRPQQRTDLYMNSFFTLTTRGKGAQANYIGIGDMGGIGGSYASYLQSVGKQAIVGKGTIGTLNLEEYTASPQAMFAEGDFRAFNAFFSNPYNNPYGYSLKAEEAYQNKLAMEQRAAEIEATSSGFLPAKQNGMVIAPAGAIQAATTNIQNLPNQIIAAASNPGELASGVIAAMANKVVSGLVTTGIGQVQANFQRQIGGVNSQVGSVLKQATGILGPAAPFTQSVLQRSIQVNPSTPTLSNTTTGGI